MSFRYADDRIGIGKWNLLPINTYRYSIQNVVTWSNISYAQVLTRAHINRNPSQVSTWLEPAGHACRRALACWEQSPKPAVAASLTPSSCCADGLFVADPPPAEDVGASPPHTERGTNDPESPERRGKAGRRDNSVPTPVGTPIGGGDCVRTSICAAAVASCPCSVEDWVTITSEPGLLRQASGRAAIALSPATVCERSTLFP